MSSHRTIIFWLSTFLLIAVIIALFFIQLYRDWAFICENTGSHKGYRQWAFGLKTGHWYKKSALEQFMDKEDPNALSNRWTSYAGTGKNIFGRPILFGHERPGAALSLKLDILDQWVQHNKPEDIKQLYDLLVSDDQNKIRDRVEEIWDEVMEYK